MTHSPDAYILHLALSVFHPRPKRSAAHGHTGTYSVLPALPCAHCVFRFGSNDSEDGSFSGAARRHARGVCRKFICVIIARVTRSFFPILTPLFLPTPFPNRLDYEENAIPRLVKRLSARRPSAKPVLKQRKSARPVIKPMPSANPAKRLRASGRHCY